MGMTISEKLLARAAGLQCVSAGDIVQAKVDKAMMDDILGPRIEIAEKLKMLGCKVWDPDKVTVISDHYTPPPMPSKRRSSNSHVSGQLRTESTIITNSQVPAIRSWWRRVAFPRVS